ncbi:unnamed protein product [Didymodactylos carnosus]|uniref:SH3 domain-containing protein n=1 Tax=Didymodactylos carnosus TaxID=1234261 RepID=A0A8S2GWY1_9BILA|nr:unnamed protein product [Didymodactylos carnosus]CAF3566978.1 unnamed protein product [Didymodactylos carnosus]
MSNGELQVCLYHLRDQNRFQPQIIRINEQSTCQQILTQYVQNQKYKLFEVCLGFEREILPNECIFDLISRNQAFEEFKIVVKKPTETRSPHHLSSPTPIQQQQRMRSPINENNSNNNNKTVMSTTQQQNGNFPGFGVDLTLSELQEMAQRQQQQIETNQQLLLAKEQRLKYLKQQEVKQQQFTHESQRLKRLKEHVEQQELKHLRLKQLKTQINEQRNSNSTLATELEILKSIFSEKEHELTQAVSKVDELTKQLDQLRKMKMNTTKEQSHSRNELEKLKQELMVLTIYAYLRKQNIRNKLNEQQSRKIAYQRDLYSQKQVEVSSLDRRIDDLQVRLKKKRTLAANTQDLSSSGIHQRAAQQQNGQQRTYPANTAIVEPYKSSPTSQQSAGYRCAYDTVHETLNNLKIAEIEKRMVQLANSFNTMNGNSTNTTEQLSSPVYRQQQLNNSTSSPTNNSPNKQQQKVCVLGGKLKLRTCVCQPSTHPKIAFASKSEIAATYMARSAPSVPSSSFHLQSPITNDQSSTPSPTLQQPPPLPSALPVITSSSKDAAALLDTSDSGSGALPLGLRLNDDILSVHFNVTNTVKKRHSITETEQSPNTYTPYSLIKYLVPSDQQHQNQSSSLIHVRDDSSSTTTLTDTKISPTTESSKQQRCYENLNEIQTNLHEDTVTITENNIALHENGSLSSSSSSVQSSPPISASTSLTTLTTTTTAIQNLKSLLKTPQTPKNLSRRVMFDPLALLLDAAVVGELDLVMKAAKEVENASQPNDEGLTALHNAVCASNYDCVQFLVEFGCDINFADNDGWTPLHCAASCNNLKMVQFLVEHGACIFATTLRDNETAAEKCEEEEENYVSCSQYLLYIQDNLGLMNDGVVSALYDYESSPLQDEDNSNELTFKDGDQLIILRRGDENESEWWWAKHQQNEQEGYVPRNYLGLYPRVRPGSMASTTINSDSNIYITLCSDDAKAVEQTKQYISSYIHPINKQPIKYSQKHSEILCDKELLNRLMTEYVVHIECDNIKHELLFQSSTLPLLYMAVNAFHETNKSLLSDKDTDIDNILVNLAKQFDNELSASAAKGSLVCSNDQQDDNEEEEEEEEEDEEDQTQIIRSPGAGVQQRDDKNYKPKQPKLKTHIPGAAEPYTVGFEQFVKKNPHHSNKKVERHITNNINDNELVEEIKNSLQGKNLRDVIIDGANVGRTYGNSEFSSKGIKLAVDLFHAYGYPDSKIVVILPPHYMKKDPHNYLNALIRRKIVQPSFHQKIAGKIVRFYDDRLVVDLAVMRRGIILSNDFYRDLLRDSGVAVCQTIKERLLCYRFIGDNLCLPNPVREGGPQLDIFLTKQ